MKKNLFILGVFCLLVIYTFTAGIVIDIEGIICFNTKYYDTPKEAFFAEHEGGFSDIEINDFIETDLIVIDEFNAFFIGIFEDSKMLVASMKTNKNKFFHNGTIIIYDLEQQDFSQCAFQSNSRISSAFSYSGRIEYDVVSLEKTKDIEDEYQINTIELKSLPQPLFFVYAVVE